MHVLPPAPDNEHKHDSVAYIVTAVRFGWLGPATRAPSARAEQNRSDNVINALEETFASGQSEHFCVAMNTTRHESSVEASYEPSSRSKNQSDLHGSAHCCATAADRSVVFRFVAAFGRGSVLETREGHCVLRTPELELARGAWP
jgi:hypothetical protein